MAAKKKEWGSKTAWSMSFFDLVPHSAAEDDAARSHPATASASTSSPLASPSEPSPPPPPGSAPRKLDKLDKARKRLELDPRTRWRCRRCAALLHPPLDAATRKPRYGVMMTEHLEGVSSGGTTHLATGVAVCAAGTLRFERPRAGASAAEDGRASIAPASSAPAACKRAREEADDAGPSRAGEAGGSTSACAPRDAVRRLLRQCQDGAQQGCSAAAAARVPPLLFIVVENPKTPANAGGILRAMRCYGVHGPAAQSDVPPSRDVEQVLRRVGGFIFSGTRLQKAMAHTDFASTLRTDPTHAGREIPQLCIPSLDTLFDVLREEYGHASPRATAAAAAAAPTAPLSSACHHRSAVRVVAVELVEGAVPLPHYEHPFCQRVPSSSEPAQSATTGLNASIPMVFYVLGAEDGTLSAHHVQDDVNDVVFMPTTGSMNLAATVNVLLYDRLAKEC